ncbi:MAG: hypothetical protein V4659_03995 [Pseudomonadota bacterium]
MIRVWWHIAARFNAARARRALSNYRTFTDRAAKFSSHLRRAAGSDMPLFLHKANLDPADDPGTKTRVAQKSSGGSE